MITVNTIYLKIAELINHYEDYLLRNNDALLNIIIENDVLSFYLSSNDKEDIFIIRFDEKDKNTLYYLSLKIIVKIFGHVIMHLDDLTLHNDAHKKSIKVDILNDEVYSIVKEIVNYQESVLCIEELPLVKDLDKKTSMIYPKSFYKVLDERVNISKKMLKSYNIYDF